jgi:TPR repeat protein
MRRFILIFAICTGVLWNGPVGADEADDVIWDRAVAAYDRGDYAEALDGYRVLAEKGHIDAQLNLGFMYDNGQGVPHYIAAAKWYRKAAEQGMPIAQTRLGDMYRDGRGVPQDDAEAVKWFRRSAEQGEAISALQLADIYVEGRGTRWGVLQDYAEAVKWYRMVAEELPPGMDRDVYAREGQSALGKMYEKGWGVRQDYVQAHKWYNLSAAQGGLGDIARDIVAEKMTPSQIEKAQTLAVEWKPKK